eukprot:TRINITY_DN915_c1_g1_i6.p1 TRINITY_DN915_c1_g1~~TRINITY_DN915_c1_g1_i6.p1  ORF type:complete len:639 (+),score=98.02 TRINITY_DN915_c1_g1_i6:64-1980(+)
MTCAESPLLDLGLFDCLNNDFMIADRGWDGVRSKWCEIREVNATGSADICFPKDCSATTIVDWYWNTRTSTETITLHCDDDTYLEWTPLAVLTTFISFMVLVVLPIGATLYLMKTKPDSLSTSPRLQLLASFDLRDSFADLCSVRGGASSTTFLDAFRVFSMVWIIMGHSYQYMIKGYANAQYAKPHFTSRYDIFTNDASYVLAVNTFFWIGGYLGATGMMRRMGGNDQPQTKKEVGKVITKGYFMRYLRTVPMLVFCILIAWIVIPRLGSGLRWNQYFNHLGEGYDCGKNWWRDLLFINTYVMGFCLGWTWYITTDFHFALILPILVLPFTSYGDKTGLVVNLVLLSAVLVMVIMIESYVKANTRAIPFILGVLMAWYTQKVKQAKEEVKAKHAAAIELLPSINVTEGESPPSLPSEPDPQRSPDVDSSNNVIPGEEVPTFSVDRKRVRYMCYIVAGLIFLGILADYQDYARLDQYDPEHSESRMRIHHVLRELFWGLALVLLGTPFILGHGGFVKKMLSHPFWCISGKLTFGAYMIHPIVMVIFESSSPLLIYSKSMSYVIWLGFSILSYGCSFILWHTVERPISNIVVVVSKNIRFRTGSIMAAGLLLLFILYGVAISPNIGEMDTMSPREYFHP